MTGHMTQPDEKYVPHTTIAPVFSLEDQKQPFFVPAFRWPQELSTFLTNRSSAENSCLLMNSFAAKVFHRFTSNECYEFFPTDFKFQRALNVLPRNITNKKFSWVPDRLNSHRLSETDKIKASVGTLLQKMSDSRPDVYIYWRFDKNERHNKL
ncbi:hypothetical protein CLF_106515 [Clonorchis sinensis]|uniref:Uncharacterized protein n=1 Tax=Clonorchis sinensis TaxID=79923 RepID=G7YFA3_CLOSI|nr:hypothetical protein CLF_106515 [Clonorchis sinensis]